MNRIAVCQLPGIMSLTLVAGLVHADPCEDEIFDPTISYSVGLSPEDIATGDFNDDGVQDLVTANRLAGTLTILLSTGTPGTYESRTLSSGAGCQSVCVGDLDGDGDLDIAAAHRNGDDVGVHIGLGNGTFASPVFYSAGNNPQQVVSVDLDQDGVLDLVTVNSFSDDVAVLTGMGDGTYSAPQSHPAGNSPVSLAFGDLDGDADLDLVVANRLDDLATVLLRGADGSYTVSGTLESDDQPVAVGIGDINGDTHNDIIVGCTVGDNMSTYAGDSTGAFKLQNEIPVGNADDIVVLDMNNDGLNDLVSVSGFLGDVAITLATPAGFELPTVLAARDDVQSLIVTDLDGDGTLDIASASAQNSSVEVVLGTGVNLYDAVIVTETGQPGRIESIIASDLDGDGHEDLIYAANGNPSQIHLRRGNEDGSFDEWLSLDTLLSDVSSIGSEDMNNDGHPDVVVCSSSSPAVAVFLNDGNSGFESSLTTSLSASAIATEIALGDFDLDGNIDVVIANESSNSVISLMGSGDGQFSLTQNSFVSASTSSIDLADINNDGLLDVACGTVGTGEVNIAYGLGDGRFSYGVDYEPDDRVYDVRVFDIDRDGVIEIITCNSINDTITITEGPLSDSSGLTASYQLAGTNRITIADFNGDEWPDIAAIDENRGATGILLSDGIGNLSPVVLPGSVGSSGGDITTVERSDGSGTDIVSAGLRVSGSFGVYRNRCVAPTPCPADLNNDQLVDFFDVARFLALYNDQSALVDFNDDGMIDFFDVAAFLLIFNQGCP